MPVQQRPESAPRRPQIVQTKPLFQTTTRKAEELTEPPGGREAVTRNPADQGNAGFLATFAIMPLKSVRGWPTDMGVLAARPAAFAVFAIYGAAWITFGDGLEWHSLATLATWGMTLVIQRAEHRDTQLSVVR